VTTPDLRDQLQQTLGDAYQLERELGGGGMSRVFVATERSLGREVVIKLLSPELSEGLNVDRFRREIQLAARLQHPHIVPLLAAGESRGLPYFTMPFVQGESLRARLVRDGELPIGEAIRILREVAAALAYAHANGVVHRDIKPDNVLVSGGSAMVTDFGVGKALGAAAAGPAASQLTQLGVALGTPAYMAPEQAAADPATDSRADIYAFGVMAYELLTGAPPFTGRPTQALMAAHAIETPEPVQRRRPSIPPALADLIMRCLAKRPADRPQTADEIVRALDAIPTSGSTQTGAYTASWVDGAAASAPAGPFPTGAPNPYATPYAAPYAATPYATSSAVEPRTGAIGAVVSTPAGAATAGRWRRPAIGLALVVALAAAWAVVHRPPGPPHGGDTMLAVLPFENDGPVDDQYFADGLTDAITNRLAGLHGLGVIDSRSAAQYRGSHKSTRDIGRELGVQYVLQGTVRWASDGAGGRKVEITPTLVNTMDLRTKPAGGPYIVVPSDVFQVDSDVATKVANALDVALNSDERRMLTRRPTRNPEAYDAYLRGDAMSKGGELDPQRIRLAMEQYQRATTLDPHFALAFAKLGLTRLQYAFLDLADSSRVVLAARTIDSALALDPRLPEAHSYHAVLLRVFLHDPGAAFAEVSRAAALRPNGASEVGQLGTALMDRGDVDSGYAYLARSVRLDPRSPDVVGRVARTAVAYRRYADAAAYADQYVALDPTASLGYEVKIETALKARADTASARQILTVARAAVPGMPLDLASYAVYLGPAERSWFAALTPEQLHVSQVFDSAGYYLDKLQLYLGRDPARVHAYGDSLLALARTHPLAGPLEFEQHNLMAIGFALTGARADAERQLTVVTRFLATQPPNGRQTASLVENVAATFAAIPNADSAIAYTRRVLVLPTGVSPAFLTIDPSYALIRQAPAFQALVAGH
jgi:serine/threonine-protein kinase